MKVHVSDDEQLRVLEAMLQTLERIERKMSALDDLKASQLRIGQAVADLAAYLRNLATNVSGGVTAADAEIIATDLNTQANNIEGLIQPPPSAPVA